MSYYFKPNKIQPIRSKPTTQVLSSEDFLSQSIVQIVNNPGNSSVFVKNQNNNSLPTIQTGLLYSFNPTTFETFRKRQVQQTILPPSMQNNNRSRVEVKFSHGNNNYQQQNFIRQSTPNVTSPMSNLKLIYPNRQMLQQHRHPHSVNNRSQSVNIIRPYSSIVTKPQNIPNLNPLIIGQLNNNNNRSSFQKIVVSKPFVQIQRKINFKSSNENKESEEIKLSLLPVSNDNNSRRQQNETSFQVVQSPVKNISSISIERSQYVLMPENRVEKKDIVIELKRDEQSLNPPAHNLTQQLPLNSPSNNTGSMIFSTQQQQSLSAVPIMKSNKSIQPLTSKSNLPLLKSLPKLDNNIYMHQQKALLGEQEVMMRETMIQQLEGVKETVTIGQEQKQQQQQKQQYQQKLTTNLQNQHDVQRSSLLRRITALQSALRQKQQQNINLHSKLQNHQLSKTLQSSYQKLQITSKLNEVQIKRLRNEIMMFKIKQRLYRNREKLLGETVNQLREELKVARVEREV